MQKKIIKFLTNDFGGAIAVLSVFERSLDGAVVFVDADGDVAVRLRVQDRVHVGQFAVDHFDVDVAEDVLVSQLGCGTGQRQRHRQESDFSNHF